ncbi:MAG TPA: Nif3-like dinuclear metal center hexameric protein [Acidobacteriaceae bacterium]|nr:Nif3-like dinuclear metal center hexameric protein [Acidobacteriaceae bacterium]
MPLSRREFLVTSTLVSGSLLVPDALAIQPTATTPLTVGNVLDRIKGNVGVPWHTPTVDNLLSATPDTLVQGVATTMMATFDVCKRAQAQGCNLIITHETPFYLHQDRIDDIRDNAVLKAKQAWLAKHNVALFHFHDHLHAMHPDGVAKGMNQQLGWESYVTSADMKHLDFKGMPLEKLAEEMAAKLHAQTIRVVGDPTLPVHGVQTSWGYCSREGGIPIMANPDIDVLICGETREWELVEYAQDAVSVGQKKGLIVVGHVLSEQGGAIFAAQWLKQFVTEVPVVFVPAAEPFWLPDRPRGLGA